MKKNGSDVKISLNTISDHSFLCSLDYKQAEKVCALLRSEILRCVSTYGGHLSSNLGDVELTVALHRVFDFKTDKLIFDVGHQCYAHKLLTGRSLEHLNQKGYVNGFQNRKESPYDVYDAGHSSTALSACEAFAYARDLNQEHYDVVGFVGDASIVNGLSLEALNDLGARSHKVIIVLNDNGMAIHKPSGGLGKFFRRISTDKLYNKAKKGYRRLLYRSAAGQKLYTFTSRFKDTLKSKLVPTTFFDNMGFTYIGPVDGHNLRALEKAFKAAKRATKSVVVHCSTIKGKGYAPAENDKKGFWHSVPPFDLATGEIKNEFPNVLTWPSYISELIHERMENDPDAILLVPAMIGGSHLERCFADFPARCIDVGIAEEHAITMAGALSLAGKKPIACLYSTFLQRAYDELLHDCARMGANLTVLIDHAGLVGKNGETHQGIYDEAFLKSIPGVTVSMPSSPEIGRALFEESFAGHGVFAIRYPSDSLESDFAKEKAYCPYLSWHSRVKKEDKIALIGVGPLGRTLYEEAEKEKLPVSYFDPVYLNPVMENELKKVLGYKAILIYDAYGTEEGFASSVLSGLMKMGYQGKAIARCVKNDFIGFDTVENQRKGSLVDVESVLGLLKTLA